MATEVPSQEDLYDLYKNEAQSRNPKLTDFEPGSNNDVIAGSTSVIGQEIVALTLEKFAKTFFSTANGPAITGGPDDLELLAVDHFGESFRRPEPSKAIGVVEFSRPNTAEGNVTIAKDTIVKTAKNSQGVELRFVTDIEQVMTGLTLNASVTAVEAGSDSNVGTGTVNIIETALTDTSIVVTNSTSFAGGDDDTDDSEYREFLRNNIERIKGATAAAIKATAENVPGVEIATVIEEVLTVRQWDIGSDSAFGDILFIPRGVVYIADANGSANQALVDAVLLAVTSVRACGVVKSVIGATPLSMDWIASVVLNPGGPNFAEFSQNLSKIIVTMEEYIRDIPIGDDFNRALAKAAILAIWGPSGTGDITDFATSQPTGDISTLAVEKLIPGLVDLV